MDATRLKNDQIDRLVAVMVMGWVPCKGDYWPRAITPGKWNCSLDEADKFVFEYEGGVVMPDGKTYCSIGDYEYNPTEKMDQCFEMQAKIADLGLINWYIDALTPCPATASVWKGADGLPDCNISKIVDWALTNAPGRQRCLAALRAIEFLSDKEVFKIFKV